MTLRKLLLTGCMAWLGLAGVTQAQFIVDGVAGGDDGSSPFETIHAAVIAALAAGEPVVEVRSNGPMGGIDYVLGNNPQALTVRAGSGFSPVITSHITWIPNNPGNPLILEGLRVQLAGGGDGALWAGGDITATNCTFRNTPGGGGYAAAIICATGGPGGAGTLTLTDCVVSGHTGIMAGRSIRDIVATRCSITGAISDLPPNFSHAVSNAMNWFHDFTDRIDGDYGIAVITEPRTLTLNECVIQGGTLLGWPPATLPASPYIENETNTVGPIKATNCVFLNGDAAKVGHAGLPAPNLPNAEFIHCTFRDSLWGAIQVPAAIPSQVQVWNCLFDMPVAEYTIGTPNPTNAQLSGDGNVYNVPADKTYVNYAGAQPWPTIAAFEATKHAYLNAQAGAHLTLANGRLDVAAGEPAAAAGVALASPVATDIDGLSRPNPVGSMPDAGASETALVPVALSDFMME